MKFTHLRSMQGLVEWRTRFVQEQSADGSAADLPVTVSVGALSHLVLGLAQHLQHVTAFVGKVSRDVYKLCSTVRAGRWPAGFRLRPGASVCCGKRWQDNLATFLAPHAADDTIL
jgi:hypothetical protein